MLADKPAFLTQTEVNEASIADDDVLQSLQSHTIQGTAPRLADNRAQRWMRSWGGYSPDVAPRT